LIRWLVGWFFGWFVGLLFGWLVGWLFSQSVGKMGEEEDGTVSVLCLMLSCNNLLAPLQL
jgi:Kef-type K+ transport system membrane component KefB